MGLKTVKIHIKNHNANHNDKVPLGPPWAAPQKKSNYFSNFWFFIMVFMCILHVLNPNLIIFSLYFHINFFKIGQNFEIFENRRHESA